MRFLALDLGDKRTGLATGDAVTRLASPLEVVELPMTGPDHGERLLDALARIIAEERPDAIVVGLPLNMDDGSEGAAAVKVRAFADRLARRAGLPVHFQDERLTTADADWSMAQSGLTRAQKKARRDALAAAAILRDFLSGFRMNHRGTEDTEE